MRPEREISMRNELALRAYLLGTLEFESALALQRRLVYDVAGDRSQAALVLCEHPPLVTVGRQGSRRHILAEPEQLQARRWQVRWVNRGGGCMLHVPGQLAIYSIAPLDRLGMSLPRYLHSLREAMQAVIREFGVAAEAGPGGLRVRGRVIAALGVAVRDWVTYYGMVLNVNPALEAFRMVRCSSADDGTMTSLERERRGPVRPGMVRERVVEHFAQRFGFARMSIFSDHPSLHLQARSDALTTHS